MYEIWEHPAVEFDFFPLERSELEEVEVMLCSFGHKVLEVDDLHLELSFHLHTLDSLICHYCYFHYHVFFHDDVFHWMMAHDDEDEGGLLSKLV